MDESKGLALYSKYYSVNRVLQLFCLVDVFKGY